jgi:hypothetical protein
MLKGLVPPGGGDPLADGVQWVIGQEEEATVSVLNS